MNQFVFDVVSMSSETKQWMKNRWVMLTHLFDKKHPDCNGIIAAWSQCRDRMKKMMQKHPNATFSLWDMTQGRCGKNNSDALRFMHHQIRQNEIADVMGKNNEFGEGGKAKTICAFELQWPTLAFDVQWPDDTLDTRTIGIKPEWKATRDTWGKNDYDALAAMNNQIQQAHASCHHTQVAVDAANISNWQWPSPLPMPQPPVDPAAATHTDTDDNDMAPPSLGGCPQGHHLKDGPCRYDYCRCGCDMCQRQCAEGGR